MKDLNKVWAEALALLGLTTLHKKDGMEMALDEVLRVGEELKYIISECYLYDNQSNENNIKVCKEELGHMLMMVACLLNDLGIDPCDALASSIAEGKSVLENEMSPAIDGDVN